MLIEACARLAHEANRIYCEYIGDPVPLPWLECIEEIRQSCIQGVEGVSRATLPSRVTSHG